METPPKRAHLEEPVKQGFNFNSCPNELKMQILSKVDQITALELLQVNRFTRNYVFEHRSYPEVIEITLTNHEPSIAIKYKGSTKPETVHHASARFPRVHSCDELVFLDNMMASSSSSSSSPPYPYEPPIRLSHVFPNLKSITKLKYDIEFDILTEIFKNSGTQIIDEIEEIICMEDQDGSPFVDFSRDHLKLCKRIDCFNHRLYRIWDCLKTMSFEHINVSASDYWSTVDILRQVLAEGQVPSLAMTAELHCQINYDYDDGDYVEDGNYLEDFMGIVNELLRLGPIEPLRDPPGHWACFAENDSCSWQFRRAVTAQRELCIWVNSDTLKMHILHRPIEKWP